MNEHRNIQIGEFVLDLSSHNLTHADHVYRVEPKDYSVLVHMIERAPEIVTMEELLQRSWPGTVVGDNSVHQVVARLRKTLGDNPRKPRYIKTLAKVGYQFVADVERSGALEPVCGARGTISVSDFKTVGSDLAEQKIAKTLQFELCSALRSDGYDVILNDDPDLNSRVTSLSRVAQQDACANSFIGLIVSEENAVQVNAAITEKQSNQVLWSDNCRVATLGIAETSKVLAASICNSIKTAAWE